MKVADIRDLAAEDLKAEVVKLHAQLFKYRFHAKNDEMQRAGEIRRIRRDIARCKTVLRERELTATRTKEPGNARN